MPVNMGLTFLIGGLLGWLVVKILKPPPYLEGIIVATCSAGKCHILCGPCQRHHHSTYITLDLSLFCSHGETQFCLIGNMGNLPIILVPAICDEDKSPFGNRSVCRTVGLSYASFSMAVRYVNAIKVYWYEMWRKEKQIEFLFTGNCAARGFLHMDIHIPAD